MSRVPSVSVIGKDKVIHSFFYFVFSVLWLLFLKSKNPQGHFAKNAVIIVLAAFFYGGLIELCQEQFTSTRTADTMDVLANVTGSLLGVTAMWLRMRFRKGAAD